MCRKGQVSRVLYLVQEHLTWIVEHKHMQRFVSSHICAGYDKAPSLRSCMLACFFCTKAYFSSTHLILSHVALLEEQKYTARPSLDRALNFSVVVYPFR